MSEAFEWEPLRKFDKKPERLPIDAPPCVHCRHWYPILVTGTYAGEADTTGVRCCHAKEMYRDFSCFDAPKEKK